MDSVNRLWAVLDEWRAVVDWGATISLEYVEASALDDVICYSKHATCQGRECQGAYHRLSPSYFAGALHYWLCSTCASTDQHSGFQYVISRFSITDALQHVYVPHEELFMMLGPASAQAC